LWSFSMLSASISVEDARDIATKTTPSAVRTPTLGAPRETASRAYST